MSFGTKLLHYAGRPPITPALRARFSTSASGLLLQEVVTGTVPAKGRFGAADYLRCLELADQWAVDPSCTNRHALWSTNYFRDVIASRVTTFGRGWFRCWCEPRDDVASSRACRLGVSRSTDVGAEQKCHPSERHGDDVAGHSAHTRITRSGPSKLLSWLINCTPSSKSSRSFILDGSFLWTATWWGH